MKKTISHQLFYTAALALILGLGSAGCTVSGNIVGADTDGAVGTLARWGSPLPPSQTGSFGPPPGTPHAPPNDLVIEVAYLDPAGYNETGHTQYYIGSEMPYEIRIYNYGVSAYPHLYIGVEQQYYNDADCGNTWWNDTFWAYDGSPVDTRSKYTPLGGDSGAIWSDVTVPAQHMVVLSDGYTIPYNVCPGLSQTALVIKDGEGNVIYYNPEAGVWDPPFQP